MKAYLDTSALVPLFVADTQTAAADRWLRTEQPVIVVSDFAGAEFISAIGRRVRMGNLTAAEAQSAFETFDAWATQVVQRIEITGSDISAASGFLRRFELSLRAPDAIHIAIAQRSGATLLTFDIRMADAAKALQLDVTTI